ncbi:MAG: hypothetical protein HYV35_06110 [Lentisphaerae bacterium]|nr:hypothetical protein [Lentisphaerota bacterium]
MNTSIRLVSICAGLFAQLLFAVSPPELPPIGAPAPVSSIQVHRILYRANLSDAEARFTVELDVEAAGQGESILPLFEGAVAVMNPALPEGWKLLRDANHYRLLAYGTRRSQLILDVVAHITRAEPWNQVTFKGPSAAVASVIAQAAGEGIELQLLAGTLLELEKKRSLIRLKGSLGAERNVALRWQSKVSEIARKALFTCATECAIQITPSVIKYTTQLHYDIFQGSAARLTVALPPGQALTKLQGEQVRNWEISAAGTPPTLSVDLTRPVEKSYTLTIHTEQPLNTATNLAVLAPPQPLQVERESGALSISAQDVMVETAQSAGLRQVNAAQDALVAYQFHARPFTLEMRLRRLEPEVSVADRVSARVEEARLLITHNLAVSVAKAGIYSLEMALPPGLALSDVRGSAVGDWKPTGDNLSLSFTSRILGTGNVEVLLERPLKLEAGPIEIAPIRVAAADKATAQVGAAPARGIQLKAASEGLSGLQEIPISRLAGRADETLAYTADQADWKLLLNAERLAARVTADIFNLVTIGDGLVGGSATIRYAILNQGKQEFRVKVPAHWKNIDFTGPNIRRKEQQENVWIISLQDKAWDGYTLVITYDFQFDPHQAVLAMAGVHAADVERETGSVALTAAANLQLKIKNAADPLRRIDELELAPSDRALVARPVLLAYRYAGESYALDVEVTRFDDLPPLQAVADHIRMTTVLTDEGQMLSQASFMVKNNDKQYLTFTLPKGAEFWSAYLRDEPVKPEKNQNDLLIPLPRGANRDEAFPVEIVYAQKIKTLKSALPRRLALAAPAPDVQTTYAEWELFVPQSRRLASFGGNMIVSRGTIYGLRDAWRQFILFYGSVTQHAWPIILTLGIVFLLIALLFMVSRGKWALAVRLVLGIVFIMILAGLFMPNLASRKAQYQRVSSWSELEQGEAPRSEVGMYVADKPQTPPPPPEDARLEAENIRRLRTADLSAKYSTAGKEVQFEAPSGVSGGGVATVAGIRPLRIDLPRTGQRFVFTKVLNVGGEPLAIRALALDNGTYKTVRGILQVVVFLAGAILLWRGIRAEPGNSFQIALGSGLALGSVGSALLSARLLDGTLILAAPVLGLAILIWLAGIVRRKLISRRGPPPAPPQPPDATLMPGPVPPLATMLALMMLGIASAQATVTNPAQMRAPTEATVLSAQYTGQIMEWDDAGAQPTAEFDAVLDLEATEPNQIVRLFGEEVAVQDFSAARNGGGFSFARAASQATLLRRHNALWVQLAAPGRTKVYLKFLVKVSGDSARRRLQFSVPAALAARMDIQLNEPEAAVELTPAVSCQVIPGPDRDSQTLVKAVLGYGPQVDLSWTPRVKRAAEIAVTVFCQSASVVTFGGGVATTRSALDYQVMQGELRQLRVQLPASERLMQVEGEAIRTWKLDDAGSAPVLTVELARGMPSAYRLTVETEKILEGAPLSVSVATPHALDVKRETGLVALRGSEDLQVSVESQREMQKIDAEEFTQAAQMGAISNIASAGRFLKPDYELQARVEPIQPLVEATAITRIVLGLDQMSIIADVDYLIKRTGLFRLRLAAPKDYKVEQVTGEKIAQWVQQDSAAQALTREIQVTLKERTSGAYRLSVVLVKIMRELPPTIELSGVQPLGVNKLTGFITVAAAEGVQVKSTAFDGLSEVPMAMVPGAAPGSGLPAVTAPQALQAGGQAFKLLAADGGVLPWKLAVTTEKVASWVRAEIMNWLTLTETLVSGRSLIRYEIQNAPTRELRFKAPAQFRNVEASGANIRQKDQKDGEWRIELQSAVKDVYMLTVTWEQTWDVKSGALDLAGVEAVGVEREIGAFGITARPPLRIEPRSASADLLKIDSRDLPAWANPSGHTPSLAYRYLRPGYQLALQAQQFEDADVLQALAEGVRLSSVVSEDGQIMTEMSLAIRNNARQYLEVALPEGASNVWYAFVAGQPVQPSVREGKLLLPLERSGAGGEAVAVEFAYVGASRFPRRKGSVELMTPAIDVPLKDARWDLYLPPDYQYRNFNGTMKIGEEPAVIAKPSADVSYSISDYESVERHKKLTKAAEAKADLFGAREKLQKGDVKGAVAHYQRASQRKDELGRAQEQELRQLDEDLQVAQSANISQSRQAFSQTELGLTQAGEKQQQTPVVSAQRYDESTARQQWSKVKTAQEIVVAKALPLRVNLPKRGIHLAFGQVLQTEVNKPMSVRFYAAKTTGLSLMSMAGLALGGLVMLWLLAARFTRRHQESL